MRLSSEKNAETQNQDSKSYKKILELFVDYLEKEHDFSEEEIATFTSKMQEPKIPVSIFCKKLGALETISKFLIENKELKKRDTARLLNRDPKTIWSTYEKAKKKFPERFAQKSKDDIQIPVSKFNNRKFSTLEILVTCLREEHGLSFKEISKMLGRSPGTLGTAYFRANKKRGELEKHTEKKDIV